MDEKPASWRSVVCSTRESQVHVSVNDLPPHWPYFAFCVLAGLPEVGHRCAAVSFPRVQCISIRLRTDWFWENTYHDGLSGRSLTCGVSMWRNIHRRAHERAEWRSSFSFSGPISFQFEIKGIQNGSVMTLEKLPSIFFKVASSLSARILGSHLIACKQSESRRKANLITINLSDPASLRAKAGRLIAFCAGWDEARRAKRNWVGHSYFPCWWQKHWFRWQWVDRVILHSPSSSMKLCSVPTEILPGSFGELQLCLLVVVLQIQRSWELGGFDGAKRGKAATIFRLVFVLLALWNEKAESGRGILWLNLTACANSMITCIDLRGEWLFPRDVHSFPSRRV